MSETDINENPFHVTATEVTKCALRSDEAHRFLIGNLVKFLADKNIIDLDEYLAATKKTKESLLQNAEEEDIQMINMVFDLHIIDFKKPE